MKADDIVDLVFVTPHNFLYCSGVSRQEASDWVRDWFNARENFRKRSWLYRVWSCIYCWLAPNTLAINMPSEKPGETFAQWSIGAESIIGMYIREREKTAQDRIVEIMEKEAGKGDEWKGD